MHGWYKGAFAGVAPIWVKDPLGDCMIHPRGIIGHILLPIAELLIQTFNVVLSLSNPEFEPHFPIQYDDRKTFSGPGDAP